MKIDDNNRAQIMAHIARVAPGLRRASDKEIEEWLQGPGRGFAEKLENQVAKKAERKKFQEIKKAEQTEQAEAAIKKAEQEKVGQTQATKKTVPKKEAASGETPDQGSPE